MTRRRLPSLLLFSAATFMFWAALYVYVPVLPLHAESMGAGFSMVGAVVASYAIAQLLLRAPMGIWADALGRRKPFVVAGLLVASLGALALAVAPNPWLLFIGRTITGAGAATWVIFSVFFAAYFPPERSARGIGIISFVDGAAMVSATLVGGHLAELWGAQSVFFIGAGLGVVGALLLVPVAEPVVPRPRILSQGALLKVATHPVVLMASLMSILTHFASAATISSFTLVYASRIGATSGDLGTVSAAYLGAHTLATLGAVYLVERHGFPSTIVLGAAIMAIPLFVTPMITDLQVFEVAQVVGGAGRGLTSTALMAWSISRVAPAQRATAMGVYQALYAVGMLSGPVLGGIAADNLGIGSVFYLSGACVVLAGSLACLRTASR